MWSCLYPASDEMVCITVMSYMGIILTGEYELYTVHDMFGDIGDVSVKEKLLKPHSFANNTDRTAICQYIKDRTPGGEDFGLYVRISTDAGKKHGECLINNRKLLLYCLAMVRLFVLMFINIDWIIIEKHIDICSIEYPISPPSMQSAIDAGTMTIKKFIDSGYNPTNIMVYGFSIGGGVSAASIKNAEKLGIIGENNRIGCYVNANSYTCVSAVTARWLNEENTKITNDNIKESDSYAYRTYNSLGIIMTSLITRLFGWEIDTVKLIKSGLSVKKMIISEVKDDNILGNQASLVKYMQTQHTDDIELVEHTSNEHHKHCDSKTTNKFITLVVNKHNKSNGYDNYNCNINVGANEMEPPSSGQKLHESSSLKKNFVDELVLENPNQGGTNYFMK